MQFPECLENTPFKTNKRKSRRNKLSSHLIFIIVTIFTGQSKVEIMKLQFAYQLCMLLSCINASPSLFNNELPTSAPVDKFPNVEIAMRGMHSLNILN